MFIFTIGNITAITITKTIPAIKTSINGSNNANKVEINVVTSLSCILDARLNIRSNSPDAFVVGTKSYGKGTVQELITLSDGTQYKMTIKKWLTPKGKCITDSKGITPDIEIKLDEKYYKTYLDSDDNQLQEAIKYIVGE